MGISGGKKAKKEEKRRKKYKKKNNPEIACSTEDMEASQKAQTVLLVLKVKSALLRTIIIESELNVH